MEDESSRGSGHPSRRTFLVVSGGLVVAGAAGGVALGLASGPSSSSGPLVAHVSAELTAAAAAERSLIATVDAALPSARGSRRAALRLVRSDHVAHLRAIEGAIADAVYPAVRSASASASSSPPVAVHGPVATAERAASRVAAARAGRLTGAPAVLLASIAAAEASHAELLA